MKAVNWIRGDIMAGLSISSTLFPYRMSMADKTPMEFTLEIKNNDIKSKNVSLNLLLPEVVAFDKTGMSKSINKKIDGLKPNEKQKFVFELHPTKKAGVGQFDGEVTVEEYAGNYDYLVGSYRRPITIRVLR